MRQSGRGLPPLAVLAGVAVLLAAALVVVAAASYRSAIRSAREGLRARALDRAFAFLGSARTFGRADAASLCALAEEMAREAAGGEEREGDGGGGGGNGGNAAGGAAPAGAPAARPGRPSPLHLLVVDREGRVVASSDPAEVGTLHPPPPLPFLRQPPAPPTPRVRERGRGEAAVVEACLPFGPAFLRHGRGAGWRGFGTGGDPPVDPGWRGPGLLCAAIPLAEGQAAVRPARVQMVLAVAVAGALLVLAAIAYRTGRQAARLAVELERRRRLAALGEMAAVVAHEIRNPVAAVRGYAQLLLERIDPADERLLGPARTVVEETDRLGRLAGDLLAFARPGELTLQTSDVAALARQATETAAGAAAAAGVRLLFDDGGVAVLAAVDAPRLLQLLANVIGNAIEVSPSGETVVVRVESERGAARVEVLDRGPGVAPGLEERIFEPFFTTRARGTGLGLAIARRIAEEHGGTLTVEPREGGGSVFRLCLSRTPRPRIPLPTSAGGGCPVTLAAPGCRTEDGGGSP